MLMQSDFSDVAFFCMVVDNRKSFHNNQLALGSDCCTEVTESCKNMKDKLYERKSCSKFLLVL